MAVVGVCLLVSLSGLAASLLVAGKSSGFFEDITLGITASILGQLLLMLLGQSDRAVMDFRRFSLTISLACCVLMALKYRGMLSVFWTRKER